MPNHYFKFKQFTIQQQHCAMKVTTDSCLFGAWAAANIQDNLFFIKRILDIGTGTGLLSIMLAQQSPAYIDAVEIDTAAAEQADVNFNSVLWRQSLKVYETPIQNYINRPYDFIISNPPFFDNDLKSPDAKRNLALHSSALSLEVLLANITRLLAPNGQFAILLPYHRLTFFEDLATADGYLLHKKTLVQQTPKHPYFRVMLQFGYTKKEAIVDEVVIKDDSNYTAKFKELLKDYYLQF
jgi:tRNA1Val (adenine37-N6)-methyltransferase